MQEREIEKTKGEKSVQSDIHAERRKRKRNHTVAKNYRVIDTYSTHTHIHSSVYNYNVMQQQF